MHRLTIGCSILALVLTVTEPALAGKEGVPGRRVGGGSRWTQPRLMPSRTSQTRLTALSFAARNHLPMSLKLKALYG